MLQAERRLTIGLVVALVLGASAGASAQATKTIEVHAKRFEYMPSEITVTKGQTIKLELVSDDVAHSLKFDPPLELNVRMPTGEKVETTITPQQVGDFKGRCGVYCGKGHGEMFFTIHVVAGQ